MSTSKIEYLISATDEGLEAVKAKIDAIAEANERINAAAKEAASTNGTGIEGVAAFQNLSQIKDATEAFQTFYRVLGGGQADTENAGATLKGFAESIGGEKNAETIGKFNESLGQYQFAVQRTAEVTKAATPEIASVGNVFSDLGHILQTTISYTLAGALVYGIISAVQALAPMADKLDQIKDKLAGTFLQYVPEIGNFSNALVAAGVAMDVIREKADQHNLSETALADTVEKTSATLSNSGLTMRQQIDLSTQLVQAQKALGLTNQQLVTDLNQIFDGNVRNTNVLAQKLDIDKQEATQLRETGGLYDLVSGNLDKFAEAGDTIKEQSLGGVVDEIRAAIEQLATTVEAPFMQPLIDQAQSLLKTLTDPGFISGAAAIASGVESIAEACGNAIGRMWQFDAAVVKLIGDVSGFNSLMGLAVGPAGQALGGPKGLQDRINAVSGHPENGNGDAATLRDDDVPEDHILDQQTVKGAPFSSAGGKKGGGGGSGPNPLKDDIAAETLAQKEYNAELEKTKFSAKEYEISSLQARQQDVDAADKYVAKLEDIQTKLKGEATAAGVAGNANRQAELGRDLDALAQKIDAAKQKANEFKVQLQDVTLGGAISLSLRKMGQEFTDLGRQASQALTGAINTGIDATSSALTGAIFQTKNWAQAFEQAGESIVQSLIKIALQQAVGHVLNMTQHKENITAEAGDAAAGAYAAVAQIPYIGPWIAPAAAALVYAGALAFDTFAEGGMVTKGTTSTADDVPIKVSRGEGIINAAAVMANGGESFINFLNKGGRLNQLSGGFASGGIVQASSGKGNAGGVHVYNFTDESAMLKHMKSTQGKKVIIDTVSGNHHLIRGK